MSEIKELKSPEYASQIPHIPVNWDDRDEITGKLLEVIEAVLPEGRQLEATKRLIKKTTNQFFMDKYNMMFDCLGDQLNIYSDEESYNNYCRVLWREAIRVNHSNVNNQ